MGRVARPEGELTIWSVSVPVVTLVFVAFHAAVCRWLVRGIHALPAPPAPLPDAELPSATVLVAARNEAEHAPALAHALLALDYPRDKLQIIVVDDRSDDETGRILTDLGQGRIEVVRVDHLPPGKAPKKNALAAGLRAARGEFILTIDADNLPPPGWARSMLAHFGPRTAVVAGLVHHAPPAPGVAHWFHGMWALDVFAHAAVQAGAIGGGMPIHANGGNLAFRRAAFDQLGGYSNHAGIVSGDDDFLLQAAAESGRWDVHCAVSSDSRIPTEGPRSFRQVWEQRKRWGSKCIHYDAKRVALLSGIFASYVWATTLILAAFLQAASLAWALLLVCTIFLEAWIILREAGKVHDQRHLIKWFPLAALIQIPIVLGAVLVGTFGRFRWKDGPVARRSTP